MLGAIYTGLSGLEAFSKGLQTISNNVTNLNTLGYKATTTKFSDVFSYGGGGLTFFGDENSIKVGNGVRFSDANVDFGQGDLQQTQGDLDLALQGSGFLVLINQGKTYYSRTGQFVVDKDGYISLQGNSDYRLAVLDSSGRAVAINLDTKRTSKPVASTTIKFADNLSSSATTASVADLSIFDSLGGKQTWQVKFDKDSTVLGQWKVTVTDQTGTEIGTTSLKFTGSTVDPATAKLTITTTPTGADPLNVVLDFSSGVTSFSAGSTSTLRAASVDGQGVGSLTKVTVNSEGKIAITYSNDKTDALEAVAIADFRDPQQLRRISGGFFENDGNGPVRLIASGVEGVGRLLAKQLESSNTDLSKQFGELILIQRGFQASSQVVSASNDMIQQLFGIRGQG
ncbi:flagellar hook protein FlgE [Novosphingobium sp. B 225]|uniref:flagellar hook protein FlgE n=1 Tax=Novosphingobium sp. B 225 TaxID=1961849 RepID=UPI000B4A8DE7|nr:flagellar hook-basal body complex protein [Novosphingobium sp. B 225]